MVVVVLILAMGSQKLLLVGKIYRLKFAGIAARVINRLPASSRLKPFSKPLVGQRTW